MKSHFSGSVSPSRFACRQGRGKMFITQLQSKGCVIPAAAVLGVLGRKSEAGGRQDFVATQELEAQVGGRIHVLSVHDPR